MPTGSKILIIEDDHFLSMLMKARLEKEGFQVTQAFDGEEALNILKKDIPSLIILDLIMPKISGFEVMETISADPQYSKVPVIVLSNLGQESDIQKVKALGAVLHLTKVRTTIDDIVKGVKSLVAPATMVGAAQK
ncbi:MAG: response regulator [Candidatus Liptonbacteria bacterium]|nr:response regulator [Candidatus Liptonbacteria bacterium]